MEQSKELFDVNYLRHLPTPDKQPLEGAFFPQEEAKKPLISPQLFTTVLTIAGLVLVGLMFVLLIHAMTTMQSWT